VTRATRTYEYEAREPDLATMRSLSGLDYLQGILRGDFPAAPIAATLGFEPVDFGPGRAIFQGTPSRVVYNPLGVVHGGWAATLLDSAMGCAVHTTLPAGKGYTTVDLSVTLVRAITDRIPRVRAEAHVLHTGGSVLTAEGRIVDDAGTLYAHATTTCLVLGPR
jgi:uncharacterized protein (TIGR00369 family)